MRRIVLALAVLAAVGWAATGALAQDYRFYYGPVYENQIRVNVGGYAPAPYYGGALAAPYYGGVRGVPYYGVGRGGAYYGSGISHADAVRRIMAAHSPDRYYTHPRSLYNGPPAYYAPSYGWGYGY